jgi:hypothetical protein
MRGQSGAVELRSKGNGYGRDPEPCLDHLPVGRNEISFIRLAQSSPVGSHDERCW